MFEMRLITSPAITRANFVNYSRGSEQERNLNVIARLMENLGEQMGFLGICIFFFFFFFGFWKFFEPFSLIFSVLFVHVL